MSKIEITINHPAGLHARPAAKFVQTATAFPCNINVRNKTNNGKMVNAKSILSVLTLGVNQGCEIEIEAEGNKEEEALEALKSLIDNNFGEESK
jgi:phosphotransferase system HPr (HPr) family protein